MTEIVSCVICGVEIARDSISVAPEFVDGDDGQERIDFCCDAHKQEWRDRPEPVG